MEIATFSSHPIRLKFRNSPCLRGSMLRTNATKSLVDLTHSNMLLAEKNDQLEHLKNSLVKLKSHNHRVHERH